MRKDPRAADDEDELEVVARLRLSIARLGRRLRQEAGMGLSPSQHSALISVANHGPVTLGHLARIERVSPPTMTRIAAKLEDDGLVARNVDPADRRICRVQITSEGERRLEHGRSRRNAWLAERLRSFGADERRRLEAALDVLEALAASPEVAEVPEVPDRAGAEHGAAGPTTDAPSEARTTRTMRTRHRTTTPTTTR